MFFSLLLSTLIFSSTLGAVKTQYDNKILLKDVKVLTLKSGVQTTNRRSYSIPQLRHVGSGVHSAHLPTVVQCTNKGSDGIDVQWECKAELQTEFAFDAIDILCEGYDYPEDPYILKGSCGLEYSLKRSYYGYKAKNDYSSLSTFFILIAICGLIYGVFTMCYSSRNMEDRQYSYTNNDYPSGSPGAGGFASPPPRRSYDEHSSCRDNSRNRGGLGGTGFWTGLGTGGLLGYMMGNRGSGTYGFRNQNYGYDTGYGSGRYDRRSSGTSSSSTTTTTQSGFGGTRRR